MASTVPLLAENPSRNRKATVVKAAWQLENAILGKSVHVYPKDIQAARLVHYDCMHFNRWYHRALLALVLLTLFEVPAWCHKTQDKDNRWTWYPGHELCVPANGGDPFLSGIWYLPPGYALILEICIEIIVLRKFMWDYELEMTHFAPVGGKFLNTNIIFWGSALAIGSIVDTAAFTVFSVPIRLTFLFRTGLLFLLPGVQSLFSSIFNLKVFTEFMSISVFLWGTMLFFAWISVTIFGPCNQVSYLEEGEPVLVNKDLDTLPSAFYAMFVAAVTGEYVDVFLPTLTAIRSSGILWFLFLILAKVLFESLTLDTLVSAYIRGAKESKNHAMETRAEGTLAAFDTLRSVDGPGAVEQGGEMISKELFLEFVNVFSRSPAMQFVPKHFASALYDELGGVSKDNFCKVSLLLESDMLLSQEPESRSPFGQMLKHYVTEPEETPAFDKLMNSVLLLNLVLVLVESAYNLNDWGDPPVWTGYVELVFSFVYLGEVAVKVNVRTFDVYWRSAANRFDFFTTFLLLFTSLLPYLPHSVMPIDLQHYANILRLLRLLRVVKQLKSLRSVQFLANAVSKMVSAAGSILLMLGCVVFFFMTLGVNLFGGVLYKGNPALKHTEYEEKHWFVFNFNDAIMAFALFFTQLLCEYVPTNSEALQAASEWGDVAWLIFPLFYFLGVAIMFEILLAFTVEAYIELREESEKEEEDDEEEEAEEHENAHGAEHGHGEQGHGHAEHGHEERRGESKAFEIDGFFEEVQEKFEERELQVHYVTQDEPNFPKLLQEAYEESMEHAKPDEFPAPSHERIAKAAWQFENAIFHTEWVRYPDDCSAARQQHFRVLDANKLYYKAIVALIILTFCEVPPWCHQRSPTQDIWSWVPPGEWCHVPNGGNAYLSTIWYIPPGFGLIIELVIEIIILRKFLLNLGLDQQHFRAIGMQYYDHRMVIAGLFLAVGSMLDTLVFTFMRVPIRLTWIFRTGLLFILPGVQRVYTLIFNKRMIGEFASVAVFFVGTVMFFAWVTVTIFKDLNAPAYKGDEEMVLANKGLSTLREATYSLFVAGIGEGFVSNFLPSFFTYRLSGIFWLVFLVIGQVLLLNLVIDAFVAAYLKGSEEELDRKASAQAQSMHGAFKTLSAASGGHRVVPEDVFIEFVEDLGKSPRMFPIERETVQLLLAHFGEVTEEKFLDACRVFQNPIWATPKDSCMKRRVPRMWEERWYTWLRNIVWEPRELPVFDGFMNQVLLANLVLVLLQSAYNLNGWGPQPDAFKILDLVFAFAYVGEVLIKLSVKSWAEYCSFWANKFDFFTTWLLLATTLLPYLPFATVQADLKHYANILRLLRLIRVVKQLKQFPRVQFMVGTVSRMVNAAGDILQLLGVLLFFFSALSMNLWGGVLYEGQPALKELDYGKKHLYVFNFNDMSMAFITFFSQLLSEYVPENADALQAASSWGNIAWYVFPAFYLLGVAIIFEITKAFTIEYYLAIKEEAEDGEEKEEEEKPSQVREELEAQLRVMEKLQTTLEENHRLDLHYTMKNDSFKFQHEIQKVYEKCLGPSPKPNGHHH